MQVRLADGKDTYYGDLRVPIAPQAGFYSWYTLEDGYSAGDFGAMIAPVTRTHELAIRIMEARLALEDRLLRDSHYIDMAILQTRDRYHIPAEAKQEMMIRAQHYDRLLCWRWPVLDCPDTLAELVFDHPMFDPY